MNKEEIEQGKQCLNEIIQNTYSEEKAIKLDNLRNYMNNLESKLNKVTDKLKEVKEIAEEDKEQKKIIELPNGIKYEDKVISLDTFIYVIDNLLNIIEGEKK